VRSGRETGDTWRFWDAAMADFSMASLSGNILKFRL
jgi:hypothetical protein